MKTVQKAAPCDLSNVGCLVRPLVRDAFQRLRPPFSAEAAQLSLRLADTAYTLDTDAWLAAGWVDVSVLIDDSLQSGMGRGVMGAVKMLRARAALLDANPLSQVKAALRQRERSDTVKAVCMMRPMEDGTFLLAIGFMGTGKRLYDWISNFRFTTEEGFHRGFYQLCCYFEENADSIVFPAAAKALGLAKLTLRDVLTDMHSPSSPFRLWMAGHSQGSAVMQVFAHRLMHRWGVPAQRMVGYGFASPTVATGRLVHDPASYPLYHILNDDDVVTRMGALLHLGLCARCPASDELRAVYGAQMDERLLPFVQGMTDMPACLLHMTALVEAVAQEKGEEGLSEWLSRAWAVPFIGRMITQAGDRAMDLAAWLVDSMQQGYEGLTGAPMDVRKLATLRQALRPLVRSMSLGQLASAMASVSGPPHRLNSAYAWIVQNGMEQLKPFIWVKTGSMPVQRAGTWQQLPYNMRTARPRRLPAPQHARKGCARTGLAARRALHKQRIMAQAGAEPVL